MDVQKLGEKVGAKFLRYVMETHMYFQKDSSREEAKEIIDGKGEKAKVPEKKRPRRKVVTEKIKQRHGRKK